MTKRNLLDFLSMSEAGPSDLGTDYSVDSEMDLDIPHSAGDPVKRIKESEINENLPPFSSDLSVLSSQIDSSFVENTKKETKNEERFPFLVDIRDENGRRPGEPEYDPSTLFISDKSFNKLTPFEKQFWKIKKKHFDTIILFKKGKFYELYEADAELVAKLFDFRVSDRVNMKMSGFPERSYAQWTSKLLRLGYKIGKVEQIENAVGRRLREREGTAENEDKLVRRELTEIVTSGTIYDPEYLAYSTPIYICSLFFESLPSNSLKISIMLYDASINRIYTKEMNETDGLDELKTIFIQRDVRELIISKNTVKYLKPMLNIIKETKIIKLEAKRVAHAREYEFESEGITRCFWSLYEYMQSLCREDSLEHSEIVELCASECMHLDSSTIKTLDMLINNYDGTNKNSLFSAINYCKTAMGERMLRRWMLGPLIELSKIEERRNEASFFEGKDLTKLSEKLADIGDIERRLGRLNNPNPLLKDLKNLVESLKNTSDALGCLSEQFLSEPSKLGRATKEQKSMLDEMLERFERAYEINNETICSKNEEISQLGDEMKGIEKELHDFLNNLRKKLQRPELSYKSINKDAYLIEAPADVEMPPEFAVISMTKTHKRYYSPVLRKLVRNHEEISEKIFQARGGILRKAVEFFVSCKDVIRECASLIARCDCYASFSIFCAAHSCCLPEFVDSGLKITNLASPVYPRHVRNDFVPNEKITVITGPNMGGKSTFLRSVALNIIIAQMGMPVLASSMKMPIFDSVFTRIGAADSLARGESTFMTELLETSKILNQATANCFVIIDELGRGTSTEDGYAIARAVLDYLKNTGCFVLFSTHYHELVGCYEGVDKTYTKYLIDNEEVVFLYKLSKGICMDSHGLQVARMAGVPDKIIKKAEQIKQRINKSVI